jgi:hypothetical protein
MTFGGQVTAPPMLLHEGSYLASMAVLLVGSVGIVLDGLRDDLIVSGTMRPLT